MPTFLQSILFTLCILQFPFYGVAQDSPQARTLFDSSEPLDIIIQADLKSITEDSSDDPEYSEAFLIHTNAKNQTFKIKIKARGSTRRNQNVCEFPPLKINFIKESTVNTVFEGQDKIKMVTHCNPPDYFQNYTLLEYLNYKIYNILTDYSFKVRPVRVTYQDTKRNLPDMEKIGFLIEDEDRMAKRTDGKIFEGRIWSTDSCNQTILNTFVLYQFMIGNTDWWVNTRHNVDLVKTEHDGLIPVPYDFDYSGIMNIPYAVPSSELPIKDVKDRFLKASCHDLSYYEETIALFNKKKDQIFSVVEENDWLEKKYKKSALKYIEDFYEIINDPKSFDNYLSQTCVYMNSPSKKAAK
jgi:hypothetical protein